MNRIRLLDQSSVKGIILEGDVKGAFEVFYWYFEALRDSSVKINSLGPIENNRDMEVTSVYDSAQVVESLPDVVVGLG